MSAVGRAGVVAGPGILGAPPRAHSFLGTPWGRAGRALSLQPVWPQWDVGGVGHAWPLLQTSRLSLRAQVPFPPQALPALSADCAPDSGLGDTR